MDNDNVLVSSSEANGLLMPWLLVPPSNYAMELEGFDLDEALAAAEESRRRYAASKWFVSNLPAVYDKLEDDVCSVCMEGFEQEKSHEGNRRIPCGHVYHSTCITTWLSHCNSCPLCRCDIM